MDIFDPVKLSIEENRFVAEHVGEPPIIALSNIPKGVIPQAVRPIILRAYELQEIEKHSGDRWVGVAAIKDRIRIFIEQMAKWERDHRTGRSVRFPSMHSFDSKGRPHLGGPGADSGQVRTYYDTDGNRKPFAIHLTLDVPEEEGGLEPPDAVVENPILADGLVVDVAKHRIECFCGHTESYKPDSRMSYNAAKSRMAKHLVRTPDNPDRHREIHTHVFGA